MIPASFDYDGARVARRRDRRARAVTPRRSRCSPAARACSPCSGCGSPRRPSSSTSAQIDELRGHQRRRRRDRDRRDDDARRGRDQRGGRRARGVLAKTAQTVADPQVRHRGTLGGALVHADPAGDLPAPILALDAELVIAGAGGERTVSAADFFVDLFTTAVGEDEILTQIRIPKHTGWGAHYEKFVRVAQPVVDRRGRGDRPKATAARSPRRKIGLTNMGSTAAARHRRRAGAGRPAGHGGGGARGSRVGGRGHQPALRPQRRRRLPSAPGHACSPGRAVARSAAER